jgi:hypothetical protein
VGGGRRVSQRPPPAVKLPLKLTIDRIHPHQYPARSGDFHFALACFCQDDAGGGVMYHPLIKQRCKPD